MEAWAAISTLLGITALLIRQYFAAKQTKTENADVANIQKERQALEDNDGSIDAVAADQHDRVQQALGGGGWHRRDNDPEEHF